MRCFGLSRRGCDHHSDPYVHNIGRKADSSRSRPISPSTWKVLSPSALQPRTSPAPGPPPKIFTALKYVPTPTTLTPAPTQHGAKENYVFNTRCQPRQCDPSKWEPLNLSKHFAPGKPRTDDSPSSWSTRAQLAGPTSVSVQDAVGISLDTASTPDSEFLHLSPAEQLIFSVDSSFGTSYSRMEKIRAILHLTNKFGMSVAYKVKATNAAAYSVSPATGVLKKGESVRVVFECQEKPAWYNPGIGKNSWVEPGAADRFLVDAFAISEAGGDSCPNYKAEWMLAAEKDHIKSYRLEVVGARKPGRRWTLSAWDERWEVRS